MRLSLIEEMYSATTILLLDAAIGCVKRQLGVPAMRRSGRSAVHWRWMTAHDRDLPVAVREFLLPMSDQITTFTHKENERENTFPRSIRA